MFLLIPIFILIVFVIVFPYIRTEAICNKKNMVTKFSGVITYTLKLVFGLPS